MNLGISILTGPLDKMSWQCFPTHTSDPGVSPECERIANLCGRARETANLV